MLGFGIALVAPQGHARDVVPFVIAPGEPLGVVQRHLEEEGILQNHYVFVLWAYLMDLSAHVQTGEYRIPKDISVIRLVRALRMGLLLAPDTPFTVIEGWNLRDIGLMFERAGIAQAEEFWELAGFPAVADYHTTRLPAPYAFAAEFEFLQDRPRGAGLEGYLFPDTYHIRKGMMLIDIIRMMLKNFDQKLTQEFREEIDRQFHSLHEIMVVASLIEREVANASDRALVAGIIWKRLTAGMPLQLDASVNYVTGKNHAAVLQQDTLLTSPYNTYKYVGLPPSPISNPGLSALHAALYPQASPFWYYLSAPNGTTIFSQTFAEHVRAKQKYL